MLSQDPISPYLFLIIMEVFTMLIEGNIKKLGFDYQPKCKGLQVSHIIFADDLFLLGGATEKSIKSH